MPAAMASFSRKGGDKPIQNAHLLNGLTTLLSDPQTFDADLATAVIAFPYVAERAEGDWVITSSEEIA